MDECPPEITDAGVRGNWTALSVVARATLISAAIAAGTAGLSGPPRQPDYRDQTGMPPPQGNPYPASEGARVQEARGRPVERSAHYGYCTAYMH